MSHQGVLYLMPVPITAEGVHQIPTVVLDTARRIRHFIVEDEKTARRHLKLFGFEKIQEAVMYVLNEHTASDETAGLLKPMLEGNDTALLSDAGCPGIADPGSSLVLLCHKRGIRVMPLPGPSSIVLSIMASGFNGQNFAFVGYLPVDRQERAGRLRQLENLATRSGQAQFFIETPYRSSQMMESALTALQPSTMLFVGCDIGAPGELVLSRQVREWKAGKLPELNKLPVVFGIFG